MISSWHLGSILVSTGAGVQGVDDKMALDREPTIIMDQAKLRSLLIKRLERLDVAIGEKRVTEKIDAIHMKELERDMFVVQDQLLRLQAKRKDQQQEKAEGKAKRQQVHKELEVAKNMRSMMADKLCKEKAYVSQLEKMFDRLMQHLIYTQGVHEDLRSKGKAMKTFTSKAEAEKAQAKVDKLKQELYVDRLTKDLEKVTQQAAVYKVHASAQARQTQELKQVLFETESVKGSLVMEHNQLFQQWNSSLMALEKQDKAFNEMQEALCNAKIVAATLHRDLDVYNKSIKEEREKNETLMRKLDRLQLDDAFSKNLMCQMQAKQEDLQAQYSTCLHILQDTEHTRHRLKKESRTLVDEMSNQRKKLEKESTVRLELEGKIMAQMQQMLINNKFSKQPTNNLAAVKKEKISQLWQLEDELKSLGQECSEISQHLDSLKLTQDALDQDIIKNEKLLTANQAVMAALSSRIKQSHAFIDINNKKIQQVREQTGHEVLNPMEIQAEILAKQNEELAEINKTNRQLWVRQQGALIQLAQEKKASTTVFLDMQTKYCVLNQRKIRIESQIELEHREKAELVRHLKTLMGDRFRLNTLISRNTQLSQALELENALKETDNLCKIKEAARERVEMKMRHEEIQEEKEMLQSYLVEADMQIKLWERKIQLLRETRSAVDSERGDIDMMKAEIHNKEVWLNQLKKQQFDLERESSAAFARRESVLLYRDVMVHSLRKTQTRNDEQYHAIKGLKRRIKNTHKDVSEAEMKIRELQENKDSLSNSIGQQKQRIMELRARNYALDNEIVKLEDDKDKNLFLLIALQAWAKQLQMVCEGKYLWSGDATSESVDTALQHHQEFAHAASTILYRVCEEFPQYRIVLRRPLLMLEAQQELSKE